MKRRSAVGNKRKNKAITEIVGTMLLLGISVSLFTIVYISVLSVPSTPPTPSANIVCTADGAIIVLKHCGGKALDLETKVLLIIGNEPPQEIIVKDYLDDESKADDLWGIGEQMVYTNGSILGNQIEINVIDAESNSIIMMGKLTITDQNFTLAINIVGNGNIAKTPDKSSYSYDTDVEIEAFADPGWTFAGWSDDLGGNTNPKTITMYSNKLITATFTQNCYTLDVTLVGNGSVTKNPEQGGCYTYDTDVDLEAFADPGWTFYGWSVDLTGSTNPSAITIDDNKDITAIFTKDCYDLNITVFGNGTVTKNPDKGCYSYGDIVELNASADVCWKFDHWSGDLTGSGNSTTITMDADKTIDATFTDQYTLTINIDGSGDVTNNPDQATYTYGTVITLTAVADSGWTFDHWSSDLTGSTNPETITIDADKTVNATFVDTAPPSITDTDPRHGEGDVEVNKDIIVTFSESMDTGTVSFSCSPTPGAWSETWSDGDTKVTYSHNDFSIGTDYTFEITAGKDLSGKDLIAGSVNPWTFATAGGCPYLYGWNGKNYELIDSIVGSSFLKRYENTSYLSTSSLEPRNGYYDLMLYMALPHTGYINDVAMWAIDHPKETKIIPDNLGCIHTIRDPQPITAIDKDGRNVTELLQYSDGDYWTSNLSGKDFNDETNLTDWIILTLPKNPELESIKLVLDVKYDILADFKEWYVFQYLLGSPNFNYLINRLENDEQFIQYFDYSTWITSAFRIQYQSGGEWVDFEDIPPVSDFSSFLHRPRVFLLDANIIEGNKIRLYMPTGMHDVDYVAVDYGPDEVTTTTELQLMEATEYFFNESSRDVSNNILSADDTYALINQGDFINYKVAALAPPADNLQRSFVPAVSGYYYVTGPVVPESKMNNLHLLENFVYMPHEFAKWTLPRYLHPEDYLYFKYYSVPFIAPPFPHGG